MATEQEWRTRVAAWRASGVTGSQFAAGKTYSVQSLYAWQRRLITTPAVRIARIVSAPSLSGTVTVERSGFRVTLAGAFDAQTFDTVVSSLARR